VNYFHFNGAYQNKSLFDLVSQKSFGEITVNQQLDEGVPLEHSDKWGKPTKPHSVSLNAEFEAH
jgi:hypothetical protein